MHARAVPTLLRHLGWRRGASRLLKALLLHGFNGARRDLEKARRLPASTDVPPRYIVWAPDYVSNSAGVQCLYRLAHDLRARGLDAAIVGSLNPHPHLEVPLISFAKARAAARTGSWVVYPEVVRGNPLAADRVARWVLYIPGALGGDKQYAAREHVFLYSDVYRDYVSNEVRGKLYMPTLERHLFFPPDRDTARPLDCFYVGKSRFKPGYVDPTTAFEITRSSPAKSELGKLFRASRALYCFDNSTALIYEALLCGCPVVIVPDGTQTFADYQKLELGTQGMIWDKPPREPQPFEPVELRANLDRAEHEYEAQLSAFIAYTNEN